MKQKKKNIELHRLDGNHRGKNVIKLLGGKYFPKQNNTNGNICSWVLLFFSDNNHCSLVNYVQTLFTVCFQTEMLNVNCYT